MAIPQKQKSTQADWADAVRLAYEQPDKRQASELVERAALSIQRTVRELGHATLAWSGGKDSQALRFVAEMAGITDSVLVISQLEWPAFLEWATDNMPWGLTIEQRPLDLDWLRRHPEMLFPDTRNASKWFRLVQHTGQRVHMKRTGSPALLMGRRRSDGNYISRDGSDRYKDRDGWWRVSPIADWSHEDVLTVLGAYDLPLPPCYWWPRGFRVGTGPWAARQWCPTQEAGWDEIHAIDQRVVETAAEANIPGAAEALIRCAA